MVEVTVISHILGGAGEAGGRLEVFPATLATEVFFPSFSFWGGVETEGEAEGERERVADSRYNVALGRELM